MSNNSILDKIKKNSSIEETDVLAQSKFFNKKDSVQIPVPALNVALSASLDGGLTPGLTVIAGPSKHFKSSFMLTMVNAYQKKYPDSAILFYDSEFGSPQSYFESFDIDTDKVVHSPITDIEVLKFDIMQQLQNVERGDKLLIIVDSLGNLASKKEVEDAIAGKSAADMTRAKQIKSLFRMVTPHLNLKDIPMVVVNHVYMEQSLYPKAIVSGGTGIMLSADNVWIVGRQQDKEGTDIVGYKFIINIEKSRYVKEKSKIPIDVTYEEGISKWSGLLEWALESGHVIKPKNGWYQKAGEEKNYREADTNTAEFWVPILKDKTFRDFVENKYKLGHTKMLDYDLSDDEIEEEIKNV